MTIPIRLRTGMPMVGQIEDQIRGLIETRTLVAGARLPSVRRFAADLAVSTFTVAAAYDRLSAANYIRSRGTAGYFVVEKQLDDEAGSPQREQSMDYLWLFRALQERSDAVKAGAGVLPASWFSDEAIKRSGRAAIRESGSSLTEYPAAMGFRPLRNLLALKLIDLGISAQSDQIMLTNGATHALDLIIRTLAGPGETVIIEEPGYYMLYAYLNREGISVIRVPRLVDGVDIEALERVLKSSKVKLLIVNSILQNPTGFTMSATNAHRLLALAEQHDVRILEDDIYCDFQQGPGLRIANLDQLSRVIYVSSFSKTVSANLRCGFIAADKQLIRAFRDRKSITCIATSELNERVIAELLASGEYRRQIEGFRRKLAAKRPKVIERLQSLGFDIPHAPAGGFFIWARAPGDAPTDRLAEAALEQGLVLAPGSLFWGDPAACAWARFNAAHCDSPEFEKRMKSTLAQVSRG